MPKRIVVVGGGAGGIGAAGAAKGKDPSASITVFTEYEDAAYSPCGIPYVHGKEIPDFERLFLGTKQQYADQGIDIRYSTEVTKYDFSSRTVTAAGERIPYDALVVATGWTYGKLGVPGDTWERLTAGLLAGFVLGRRGRRALDRARYLVLRKGLRVHLRR